MADLLVERAEELAAIEKAIRMARAGCARRVLITGLPGSGRTTLLDVAGARARDHGITVLAARGEPCERGYPFALARRLLDLSSLGEGYDALLEVDRALARRAPALVTVDDLEDCDSASLDWLAFTARRWNRWVSRSCSRGTPRGSTTTWCCRCGPSASAPSRPCSRRAGARGRRRLRPGLPCRDRRPRAAGVRAGRGGAPPSAGAGPARRRPVPPAPARAAAARRPPAGRCDRAAGLRRPTLHAAATLTGLALDDAAAAADRLRSAGLLAGGPSSRSLHRCSPGRSTTPSRLRAAGLAHPRGARGGASGDGDPPPAAQRTVGGRVGRRDAVGRRPPGARGGGARRGRRVLRRAAREGVRDRGELLIALAEAERRLSDADEIAQLVRRWSAGRRRPRRPARSRGRC